jgi:hypothetical protein
MLYIYHDVTDESRSFEFFSKQIISINKLFVIMNCFPYQNCALKNQAVYRDYEQCSTSGHRGKHGCRIKIISFVQADGIQKTGVAHQGRGIIVRRDLLLCVTREIICIMRAARGSTSIAQQHRGMFYLQRFLGGVLPIQWCNIFVSCSLFNSKHSILSQ